MLGSLLKRAVVRPASAMRLGRSLVARSAAKPSVCSAIRPAVATRSFTSGTKAVTENKDDALTAEAPKGILNRGYEWYPVIGLGVAAAVTQEWWIVDELWITGGCFFGVLYTAYVLGFDSMAAKAKAGFQQRATQTQAAFGIRLDMLKRYQMLEEFSLTHAAELRNLYAEEAKINAMAVDYQNLKHKNETRNAVLHKLKSIKVLEEDARRQAIAALGQKAGEYVQTAFASAPAAVKNKQIDSAIANIVPELSTRAIALARAKPAPPLAADDPVKLLFDEFLATPRTFEQLGVENFVAKFMDRKKSQKH